MADQKIWARLDAGRVVELLSLSAGLVPGTDVPAIWSYDVTEVAGIEAGWLLDPTGSFAAPLVDLATLRDAKVAQLSASCADAIVTGGFASSALGAVHGYPLDRDSQSNLTASVTASLLPSLPADWATPFWCADASGTWSFAPHTAAQIQQVGRDGMAVVVAARLKLQTLSVAVGAAISKAEIEAVAWS